MRNFKEPGIYVYIGSGEPFFASSNKFQSGCDWPIFTKPIESANINQLREVNPSSLRFIHRDDMEVEGYGAYLTQVEDVP